MIWDEIGEISTGAKSGNEVFQISGFNIFFRVVVLEGLFRWRAQQAANKLEGGGGSRCGVTHLREGWVKKKKLFGVSREALNWYAAKRKVGERRNGHKKRK